MIFRIDKIIGCIHVTGREYLGLLFLVVKHSTTVAWYSLCWIYIEPENYHLISVFPVLCYFSSEGQEVPVGI